MKICTFSGGEVQGGKRDYIDMTNTDAACASLVMKKKPSAMGATWAANDSRCYAEFGDYIVSSSKYKTCLFRAGKMCSMNLGLIFQQI